MARILLIDDDPAVLLMEARILSNVDHDVVTATDGKKGLRLFERGLFDVIITDIVMPEKEGLEVIGELHHLDQSQKIIAVSGGGRIEADGYLTLAHALGASDTLKKPFTPQDLINMVDKVLSA